MPSVSNAAEDGASSTSNGLSTAGGGGATPKPTSELTPIEEPEKNGGMSANSSLNRSPKRQSSTVYEKVCAKLSRSLTSSTSSPSLRTKAQNEGQNLLKKATAASHKAAPLATEDDEDDILNSPKVSSKLLLCHSEFHHGLRLTFGLEFR